MAYQRLALVERYQIGALKNSGLSVREIGRVIGRNASTISREIGSNGNWMGYFPQTAHALARDRRRTNKSSSNLRIRGALETSIRAKLELDWSPEQICGRLLKKKRTALSYSTVYRFIYRDAKSGGTLWTHLRTQRKSQRRQKSSILSDNFKSLKDVRSIKERPKIVEKKRRLGDLERDLVCGTKHGAVILTINDRVSRRVKLAILPNKSAKLVHKKTVSLLRTTEVKTLTNDNGSEFAKHKITEKTIGARVYFSHKGCAWERGANENTNGLLRQYFPRSTDFSQITPKQIAYAESRLNNRPRKCIGYWTPNEVHANPRQVLR